LDYAEGLFLGRYWSDTDFENRRHIELFLLYGILTSLLFAIYYWTGDSVLGVGEFTLFHTICLILISLLNPLICFKYYRMPFWGKLCVLFGKVFKAYLVMSLTVSLAMPKFTVQSDGLRDFLVDFLNSTLETYTQKYASGGGSFSTVMGVLSGGVHIVLIGVLFIAGMLIIPGLFVIIYKLVQYLYDFVIDRLVLRRVFRFKR
jgi:hypothetical protein